MTLPQLDPYAARLRALNPMAPLPATGLPPAEAVAPHDPELAALIDTTQAAQSREIGAAMAWQAGEPGGATFNAALAAEADTARRHLAETGTLPDDPSGPLLDHLTVGRYAAYVAAVRTPLATDHAVAEVYRYAVEAHGLRERLDMETDRLRDEMAEHLTAARDRNDRGRYVDAERLKPAWNDTAAVFRWLVNPRTPYRRPVGNPSQLPWPKELGYLDWQADAVINGGKERALVPEPAVPYVPRRAASQSPDMPAAVVAPEPRWARLFGGRQ
jgi:hypothetical protein